MINRMRLGFSVSIVAAALGLLATAPASAEVIFQSIPDLTAAPADDLCSKCTPGSDQSIGEKFSLAVAARANTVTFTVQSNFAWPTSVTVGIYQDLGGTVGSAVYDNTFSTFLSDVPTPNGTDVVTVDIGAVALAAGGYLLFFTNPDNLGIPAYTGSAGNLAAVFATADPLTGFAYESVTVYDAGVSISGVVPEPSTWTMMALGFAGLSFAGYRRSRQGWSKPGGRIDGLSPARFTLAPPAAR